MTTLLSRPTATRDEVLHRDVAIKVLTDSSLEADGRGRLLREARAAARLNHPNIIAIYDVAEADPGKGQHTRLARLQTGHGQTSLLSWPSPGVGPVPRLPWRSNL